MKTMVLQNKQETSNWLANLTLLFSGRKDKTIIAHKKHCGPLVIQKPFYPEGKVCHVYLLHPPGGVVGGDQLILNIEVNKKGHALVTTPGATKIYRSAGQVSKLNQTLSVSAGSSLEWFPQETILFSACEVNMKTIVQLEDGADFIGWEIICLGRPASGELFEQGNARQCFELYRNNKPLLLDRARLGGNDDVLYEKWGMQGFTATGTMMMVNANESLLQRLQENMPLITTGIFSVTLINDVLVCRALSDEAENIRKVFVCVWILLREELLGCKACEPRIWFT